MSPLPYKPIRPGDAHERGTFQNCTHERMKAPKFKFLCWIFLLPVFMAGSGSVSPCHAQQFISGPSMGLDDAKSALRNPATISFHRPQLALGVKAHHTGISNESGVPLRQGFLAGSTPFLVADRIGFGGSVRYFDTPIFKKRAFGASVTGRIFRFLSVGIRASALNLAYNQSEYTGVNPNDPVIGGGAGKTTFTGTAGIFAKPLPNLNLAVGGRNLNRPNLAVGSENEFRAQPEFFGGVSYAFKSVRARAEVSSGQYGVDVRVGVEAYSTDGSYIRAGSDASFNNARIEGQLHVSGPFSVNYQYNVPTSDLRGPSSGSHQFTVLYEFGRTPEVPEMPTPPSLLLEANRSEVDPTFEPRLHISSSHEILQHVEKQVERKINVPDEVLQNVSREALGRLDSSLATSRGRASGRPSGQVPDHVKVPEVLSAKYDSSLSEVGRRLNEGTPRTLEILKEKDSVRAFGLYNRLQSEEEVPSGQVRMMDPADSLTAFSPQAEELPRRESLSILNPESTTLTLLFPYLPAEGGVWTLTVEDGSGEIVRTFTESGRPSNQLEWDWTNEQGEPLNQGVYTCQFRWEGPEGTYQSNQVDITVRKTVRKVTIEVTGSPEALDEPADALELRPKK